MRKFWCSRCFGAIELGRAQVARGRGRQLESRAPQVLHNWRRRHFSAKNPAPACLFADKRLSARKCVYADNTCRDFAKSLGTARDTWFGHGAVTPLDGENGDSG